MGGWRARLVAHPVGRLLLARLVTTRVVESSLVLAAQAFLALFPLIILVYAVAPPRASTGLAEVLRDRFGLGRQSSEALTQLLVDRDAMRRSLSVIGGLIVIGSATAFTRALQRVYERAWDLPRLGLRGLWRGVAWLGGVAGYFTVLGAAVQLTRSLHLGGLLGAAAGLALWWWTPYLLLGGRVRWRALAAGAVLTTLAQLAVSLASATVMPRSIRSNESRFGPIGVVFAVESWLVVVCGVVVVAATAGAVLGNAPGRLGRWARGTADPDGWRRQSSI